MGSLQAAGGGYVGICAALHLILCSAAPGTAPAGALIITVPAINVAPAGGKHQSIGYLPYGDSGIVDEQVIACFFCRIVMQRHAIGNFHRSSADKNPAAVGCSVFFDLRLVDTDHGVLVGCTGKDGAAVAVFLAVSAAAGNGSAVYNQRNRIFGKYTDGTAAYQIIVAILDGSAQHMEAAWTVWAGRAADDRSCGNRDCTAPIPGAILNDAIMHGKLCGAINAYTTRKGSPVYTVGNNSAIHVERRMIHQLHAAGLTARTGILDGNAVIHVQNRCTAHVHYAERTGCGGKNEDIFRIILSLLGSQIHRGAAGQRHRAAAK